MLIELEMRRIQDFQMLDNIDIYSLCEWNTFFRFFFKYWQSMPLSIKANLLFIWKLNTDQDPTILIKTKEITNPTKLRKQQAKSSHQLVVAGIAHMLLPSIKAKELSISSLKTQKLWRKLLYTMLKLQTLDRKSIPVSKTLPALFIKWDRLKLRSSF